MNLVDRFEGLVGHQVYRLRSENCSTYLVPPIPTGMHRNSRPRMPPFTQHGQRNSNALGSAADYQPLRAARNKSAMFESQLHKFVNPHLVTSLNRRAAKAACETEKICKMIKKLRKYAHKSDRCTQRKNKCCELMARLKTMLFHQKNEWQCVGRLKETMAIADDMKSITKFICQLTHLLDQASMSGCRRLSPERPPSYEITCGLTDESFITNRSQNVADQTFNMGSCFDASGNILSSISPRYCQDMGYEETHSDSTISICLDFDNGEDDYDYCDDNDDDYDDDGHCGDGRHPRVRLSTRPKTCGSKTCGSKTCGSKTCGSKTCGSKTCGSKTCGSKTCGSKTCGSKTCGSKMCGSKRTSSRRAKSADRHGKSKKGSHHGCGCRKSHRKVTKSHSDSQASCCNRKMTSGEGKRSPHPRSSSPKKTVSISTGGDRSIASRSALRHHHPCHKTEKRCKSSSPRKQLIISADCIEPVTDSHRPCSRQSHNKCSADSLSDIIEKCVCKCLEKTMKNHSPHRSTHQKKECHLRGNPCGRVAGFKSASPSRATRTDEQFDEVHSASDKPTSGESYPPVVNEDHLEKIHNAETQQSQRDNATEHRPATSSRVNRPCEAHKMCLGTSQQHSRMGVTINNLSDIQETDSQVNQPLLSNQTDEMETEQSVKDSTFIKRETVSPTDPKTPTADALKSQRTELKRELQERLSSLSLNRETPETKQLPENNGNNDLSSNHIDETKQSSYVTVKSRLWLSGQSPLKNITSVERMPSSSAEAKPQPSCDSSESKKFNLCGNDMDATIASSLASEKLPPSFSQNGTNNRIVSRTNNSDDDMRCLAPDIGISKNNSHGNIRCVAKRCGGGCHHDVPRSSAKTHSGCSQDRPCKPCKTKSPCMNDCSPKTNKVGKCRSTTGRSDKRKRDCSGCGSDTPIAIEFDSGEAKMIICLEASSSEAATTSSETPCHHSSFEEKDISKQSSMSSVKKSICKTCGPGKSLLKSVNEGKCPCKGHTPYDKKKSSCKSCGRVRIDDDRSDRSDKSDRSDAESASTSLCKMCGSRSRATSPGCADRTCARGQKAPSFFTDGSLRSPFESMISSRRSSVEEKHTHFERKPTCKSCGHLMTPVEDNHERIEPESASTSICKSCRSRSKVCPGKSGDRPCPNVRKASSFNTGSSGRSPYESTKSVEEKHTSFERNSTCKSCGHLMDPDERTKLESASTRLCKSCGSRSKVCPGKSGDRPCSKIRKASSFSVGSRGRSPSESPKSGRRSSLEERKSSRSNRFSMDEAERYSDESGEHVDGRGRKSTHASRKSSRRSSNRRGGEEEDEDDMDEYDRRSTHASRKSSRRSSNRRDGKEEDEDDMDEDDRRSTHASRKSSRRSSNRRDGKEEDEDDMDEDDRRSTHASRKSSRRSSNRRDGKEKDEDDMDEYDRRSTHASRKSSRRSTNRRDGKEEDEDDMDEYDRRSTHASRRSSRRSTNRRDGEEEDEDDMDEYDRRSTRASRRSSRRSSNESGPGCEGEDEEDDDDDDDEYDDDDDDEDSECGGDDDDYDSEESYIDESPRRSNQSSRKSSSPDLPKLKSPPVSPPRVSRITSIVEEEEPIAPRPLPRIPSPIKQVDNKRYSKEETWYETEDGLREFLRRWWKFMLLALLNLYLLYMIWCIFTSPTCVGCQSIVPNIFKNFITCAKRSIRLIHYGSATV